MPVIIDQFDAETIQLCDDLLAWLPKCLPDDIARYGRALPEEFWSQISVFETIFTDRVIECRNSSLRTYLASNAFLIMDELDLQQFIVALANYNQVSVIANFKIQYPNLQATPSSQSMVEWAKSMVVLWKNTFYVLTYKRYIDYSVYLKSLLKLQLNGDQIAEAYAETRNLLKRITDSVYEANFSRIILSADLSHDLMVYLGALSFFPKEYCQNLVSSSNGRPLFELFTTLEYLLDILDGLGDVENGLEDEGIVLQVLWDALADDLEQDVMLKNEQRKLNRQVSEDKTVPRDDLLFKLVELFSIDNINSGYCGRYLHEYIALLNSNQKQEFRSRLILFFQNSPLMQTLFDGVDVDFFFSQIGPEGKGRSKVDFINSLSEFVSPELWPISQKLMLLLASTI